MILNIPKLSEIPTDIPVVDAGEYDAVIEKVDFKEEEIKQGADGTSKVRSARYNFELKITTEGSQKGRKVYEDFPVDFLQNTAHPVTVKFGHLCIGAGVKEREDGLHTEDFIGKSVHIFVTHRPYKEADGTQKVAAQVKDYAYKA